MGIEKMPVGGAKDKKAAGSEIKVSPEGEMVYAKDMHERTVQGIISEQVDKGLKTDEMLFQEKAAEATKQILQYLSEKYELEKNGPEKRNLELFKFFSKGPDKDNLFRLNRSLSEKAGFEIDFSDSAIMEIGNKVMGKENFRNYLSSLVMEMEHDDEDKRVEKLAA